MAIHVALNVLKRLLRQGNTLSVVVGGVGGLGLFGFGDDDTFGGGVQRGGAGQFAIDLLELHYALVAVV